MNEIVNYLDISTLPALAAAATTLRWGAFLSFGILAVTLKGERAERALTLAVACVGRPHRNREM